MCMKSYNGGVTLWFTGLPCSGKTTIAEIVRAELTQQGITVELLDGDEIRKHFSAGVGFLAAGWLIGALGLCPVVKRIWTPSWTLFSGGWCFLLLAAFYAIVDLWQRRAWAFPLPL